MKRSVVVPVATALLLVLVLGAIGAITFINHSRPQALGLAQAGHQSPATSPLADDPLTLACRPPAVRDNRRTGVDGLWSIRAGSMVGYQAREKFADITSPHVAVARTDQVAGWLLVATTAREVEVQTGCVAVDVRTLRSQDQLPGLDTTGRDDIARQMLSSREHPYVIFQPYPAPVSLNASSSAVQHVRIEGDLEIAGMTKPAQFALDVRLQNDELAAAGSTVVPVGDYGIEVPQEAGGFVQVDPNITLEVSLVLVKPLRP